MGSHRRDGKAGHEAPGGTVPEKQRPSKCVNAEEKIIRAVCFNTQSCGKF